MLKFPSARRPPKTIEEVDDLLDDLVKDRLLNRLSAVQDSAQPASGANDTTSQLGPEHTCSVIGAADCHCSFCKVEERSDVLPGCKACEQNFQKKLDDEVDRTLAVLAEAQNIHFDSGGKRISDSQKWLDWYAQLFAAIITICTLGAGFTFSIVFSGIQVPIRIVNRYKDAMPEEREAAETAAVEYIRQCLAVSWMLFVFSIGFTTFVALITMTVRERFLRDVRIAASMNWKWGKRPLLLVMSWATLAVQILPVGAFIASAEALRQYNEGIGVTSLIGTAIAGLVVWFAWAWQNL
jgi:hypothetical protein